MTKFYKQLKAAEKECKAWHEAHIVDGIACFDAADILNSPYGKLDTAIAEAMRLDHHGCLTLHFCRGGYPIGLERIRDPLDLLAWIRHLCSKNWMKTSYVEAFIDKVFSLKGWKLPHP